MIVATLKGPRNLVIEEIDSPKEPLAEEEILVKTKVTAFKIGTDRGNYEGAEQVPGSPPYPRSVGDSNLGVVQAVGKNVKRFNVGDRVVSRAFHQSEYIANLSDPIVKVPEKVKDEDAVWAHLYTLSHRCFTKANFVPSEYVAIIGLGTLGLGAVGIGASIGARTIAIGNNQLRCDLAKKFGADHTLLHSDPDITQKLNDITDGNGVDLVILTANPWPAFKLSLETVRPNGRVSIVSLIGRGETELKENPLPMNLFYLKGISLIAVNGDMGYLYPLANNEDRLSWNSQCDFVLQLMKENKVNPSELITHRLHYKDMQKAYEMAYNRDKQMLGVVFDWE